MVHVLLSSSDSRSMPTHPKGDILAPISPKEKRTWHISGVCEADCLAETGLTKLTAKGTMARTKTAEHNGKLLRSAYTRRAVQAAEWGLSDLLWGHLS